MGFFANISGVCAMQQHLHVSICDGIVNPPQPGGVNKIEKGPVVPDIISSFRVMCDQVFQGDCCGILHRGGSIYIFHMLPVALLMTIPLPISEIP